MIVYWEIHVGLIVNDGPGKGSWSYGVKGWRQGETDDARRARTVPDDWSGNAPTEAKAWEAVERLKKKINGDWP